MVRLLWKTSTTRSLVEALPDPAQRDHALAARHFLRESSTSSYKLFDDEHIDFLARHPAPDDRQRRRRLQFIERVGVECAVWP
eukprot:12679106-Prorocentrum_lima.AAC.1